MQEKSTTSAKSSTELLVLPPADKSTGDRCREFPDAESLKAYYTELDTAIRQDCGQFAAYMVHAEILLKQSLMPRLDRMQALLSQRGSEHNLELIKKLRLPSWKEYAAEIARQLKVDIRTLRRHLKYFREPKPRLPAEKPVVVHLTPQQQRRLLQATVIMNEAVEALDNGGDYQTPIREYKKVALGTTEVSAMLDAPTPPDEITALGLELARGILADAEIIDLKLAARRLLAMAEVVWKHAPEPEPVTPPPPVRKRGRPPVGTGHWRVYRRRCAFGFEFALVSPDGEVVDVFTDRAAANAALAAKVAVQ